MSHCFHKKFASDQYPFIEAQRFQTIWIPDVLALYLLRNRGDSMLGGWTRIVCQSHFPEQGTKEPLVPVTVVEEPASPLAEAVIVIDPGAVIRTMA